MGLLSFIPHFLKDAMKNNPRLFDLALYLVPDRAPASRFFDELSRTLQRRVRFVQIGANDGLRWDPLRKYVVRDRWTGIFVEPLPFAYERLRQNYRYLPGNRFVFVNAAVSDAVGQSLPFFSVSDEFLASLNEENRFFFSRLSSVDCEHVLRALRSEGPRRSKLLRGKEIDVSGFGRFVKQLDVPYVTFEALVERYSADRPVDLLVIDAEGHETRIVPSLVLTTHRPKAIFFESHNLGSSAASVFAHLKGSSLRSCRYWGRFAGHRRACRQPLADDEAPCAVASAQQPGPLVRSQCATDG